MYFNMSCSIFSLVCFVNCLYSIFQVSAMDNTDNSDSKEMHHFTHENLNKVFNRLNNSSTDQNETVSISPNIRVKRQSSGGKYTDAAQMPQVRVLRLILQMIRNSWASVYVGGAHPFHHEVPKPVVELFKDKIAEYFFPTVGKADPTS